MKLTFRGKLGYASAAFGDAATYSFLGTFLMFFLTVVAGISPVAAGAIAAFGSVWDTLWSPIVGYWSDHTRSKMGRRRPFLLFSAFPLAVSVCLLFTVIDASAGFKVVYYTLMVMIFWTAFASFFNPYLALGAEFTGDYDERTLLRSYAFCFNMLGTVVGMVLPTMIVDILISRGSSLQVSWTLTAGFVGITALVSILITWFSSKSKDIRPYTGPEIRVSVSLFLDIFREFGGVLKLKPVKFMLGACMLYLMTNTLYGSDRLYFFTYNMKFSAQQITILMFVNSFISIFFIPFIVYSSKRLDKRRTMMLFIGFSAILLFSAKFTGIPSFVAMIALTVAFGFGNAAYWQVMPALLYDVCEYDELETGNRREGTISSLLSLSEALAAAFAMQILGIILECAGFDGKASVQTATTLVWIENALTLIPALFMFGTVFMLYKYPITKKSFAEIQAALRERKGE